MRYTHAVTKMDDFYNLQNNRWPWFICIILGVLFDMAKEAVTNSVPICVIVAILGSVVCFLVIRFLENMLGKGIDKATDTVANQFAKRSQKNEPASGNLADRFQTSNSSQPTATQAGAFCTKCGAEVKPGSVFCAKCGAELKKN